MGSYDPYADGTRLGCMVRPLGTRGPRDGFVDALSRMLLMGSNFQADLIQR